MSGVRQYPVDDFQAYAVDGVSALEACCVCSGGHEWVENSAGTRIQVATLMFFKMLVYFVDVGMFSDFCFAVSCDDNALFTDSYGYSCTDWVGYVCPEEMQDLQTNCPVSCDVCPGKRSRAPVLHLSIAVFKLMQSQSARPFLSKTFQCVSVTKCLKD